MLAGRIKLRTFIGIAAAVGLLAIGGGYAACDWGGDDEPAEPIAAADLPDEPSRPQPVAAPLPPPAVAPSPQPAAVDGPSERAVDKAVMRWVGRNLGSKKRKDVSSGEAYKINVYQDAGNAMANRAKVDLDRDGKWDEKWTFKPGEISRKVSSNDDDSYDKKQLWKDGAWADR